MSQSLLANKTDKYVRYTWSNDNSNGGYLSGSEMNSIMSTNYSGSGDDYGREDVIANYPRFTDYLGSGRYAPNDGK